MLSQKLDIYQIALLKKATTTLFALLQKPYGAEVGVAVDMFN
ncbi:MAG: hypothetical protein S4CHLAM37_16410 [Chlamydiia bacterium]|nr:hypothetical protein [Chlamydiia bacterium]